ncbi:Crp/Fnr family transcriptional regulator [Sphingomonas sp.]|uniref:Crp/Fnr family transcriptional regulator n=1 Tax=Sphingomonas sp. TaxID=28214 RepID=UPI00286EA8E6|nr:Crp/Fnr family transcriptional regulator [Sphingomonas sp.]
MSSVAADELSRIDQAFANNRLLATFAPDVRALIEPHAEVVELDAGTSVLRSGNQVEVTLFPYGPTMISMMVDLADGRSVEVASVGQEGAVGGIVSCGSAPAYTHAEVQVAGPALKVPMRALEDAKSRSGFLAHLFCRYSDYLLAQVMQSVACNAYHSIRQRAARWLLTAQDRAGDRLELTQEALAGLLGVQRTTVNAAIQSLQEDGLINIRRGAVVVTDRAGLKHSACECYARVDAHFTNILGASGSGGTGPACD